MSALSSESFLACLADESVIARIKAGITVAVFNCAEMFIGDGDVSLETPGPLVRLRRAIPELREVRLRSDAMSNPVEQRQKLAPILEHASGNIPQILFVDASQEEIELRSVDALSTIDSIEATFLADAIVAGVLKNAIVVKSPRSQPTTGTANALPMTVIEETLLAAMTADGLEVKPQVSFSPYVVDFLVGGAGTRLAVEADGAAFHDAERDAVRDKHLRERYGLRVERFSGSRIMRDPSGCVRAIRTALSERSSMIGDLYPYEGLADLDQSQRIAVEHRGSHARVLAPAGSGKTKVLVNRIIRLLNTGCSPEAILVLAFNKKAATQLEERLRALGVSVRRGPKDYGVWVATLNSFGNRVLQTEGQKLGIIDSSLKEHKLVSDALAALGITLLPMRGVDQLATIALELARIRRGLRSPVERVVEIPQPSGTLTIGLQALWQSVRNLQASRNYLTFDDQIFLAADLLLREPMARHDWQSRFEHVLVDEYQDLNDAQILLLRVITGGMARIFAVGDDDQVIYSWRDARVVNLLEEFEVSYPGTTTFTLNVNYRCPKVVVRCAQRIIQWNTRRYPKNIVSAPVAPDGRLEIVPAQGLAALGKSVVDFLSECREQQGSAWRDMAVLARTKVQLLAAAVALDKAGIPRGPLPNIRLFSTPVGRWLIAYVELCHAPSTISGPRLAAIINRPNRFIGKDVVERISKTRRDPWLSLNLLAYGCPGGRAFNSHLRDLVVQCLEVRRLSRRSDIRPIDVVDAVVSRFSFATNRARGLQESDDANDEMILDIIRESARDFETINDFLNYAESQSRNEVGENIQSPADGAEASAEPQEDFVTLSTIHGAKGREWPVVSLFDLSQPTGKVPTPDEEEEERRIVYVGITRASKMLHVSFAGGRASSFIGEAFVPDRLHLETDLRVVAWRREKYATAERLRRSIGDSQKAITSLAEETAKIESRRHFDELKHASSKAVERLESLQDQFIEIGKKRPGSLFARLFRGGSSAAQLSRDKQEVGKQISIAERIVSEKKAKMRDYEKEAPKRLAMIDEERKTHTRNTRKLEAELAHIEGDLEDLDRVTPILADIRSSLNPSDRKDGGNGVVAGRGAKSERKASNRTRTKQTVKTGRQSPVIEDNYDAASREAQRVAEEVLRPYRTPSA